MMGCHSGKIGGSIRMILVCPWCLHSRLPDQDCPCQSVGAAAPVDMVEPRYRRRPDPTGGEDEEGGDVWYRFGVSHERGGKLLPVRIRDESPQTGRSGSWLQTPGNHVLRRGGEAEPQV